MLHQRRSRCRDRGPVRRATMPAANTVCLVRRHAMRLSATDPAPQAILRAPGTVWRLPTKARWPFTAPGPARAGTLLAGSTVLNPASEQGSELGTHE